jgi:hypothetical protein
MGAANLEIARGLNLVASLLDRMREFVCEQLPSGSGLRFVERRCKHNIATDGECRRVHRLSSNISVCSAMNAHRAKIVTETRFQESARGRIQGMSRRLQGAIHQGTRTARNIPRIVFCQRPTLQWLLFRFAFLAFTRTPWHSSTSAFAL